MEAVPEPPSPGSRHEAVGTGLGFHVAVEELAVEHQAACLPHRLPGRSRGDLRPLGTPPAASLQQGVGGGVGGPALAVSGAAVSVRPSVQVTSS